jgi:hypothetical protein
MASSFSFICDTGRVTIATNNKIMNEKNDWIVITASITYFWSFVTQIFRNGLPSHGGGSTTFDENTSI